MIHTVYIETTVISYLTARPSRDLLVAAHQQITNEWWESRRPAFAVYVSQFVVDEASGGDEEAASRRLAVLEGLDVLDATEAVAGLAGDLVDLGPIPRRAAADAAHIAVAAVHGIDYLLTWNCTHIANAEMFHAVAERCAGRGFSCPIICTPEELMGENA